jgi:hypothetical protein
MLSDGFHVAKPRKIIISLSGCWTSPTKEHSMKDMPSRRRRCDARVGRGARAKDRALMAGEFRKLMRSRCRNWALPGSTRCRLHGGLSTGPLTPEGLARTVAAMKVGRARWVAKLKAEGKPIPAGRKKGGRNRSLEQREQAAYEKQCARDWHRVVLLNRRQARRAQRWQERKRAAEDEARRKRFHAGGPFWTEEEWEAL